MIKRKIAAGATIHTFKVVALENVLPGKGDTLVWRTHVTVQADYRGHWKAPRDASQYMAVCRAHHFAFVEVNEDKGALN